MKEKMSKKMEKITYYENQFIQRFFKTTVLIQNATSASDCRSPRAHSNFEKIENATSVSDCRSPRAHTNIVKIK